MFCCLNVAPFYNYIVDATTFQSYLWFQSLISKQWMLVGLDLTVSKACSYDLAFLTTRFQHLKLSGIILKIKSKFVV